MAIETFAKKIKTLRQLKGLTLEQVGNAVGVGKSTVRKWESGMISNMGMDKILPLAHVLGTTPIELLNLSTNEEPNIKPAIAKTEKAECSTDDNKRIFAENLKRHMALTGTTRNELSKTLGVSYYTISDWINGKKYPRIDKIEMLASFFGISKSALIECDCEEPVIEKEKTTVSSEEQCNKTHQHSKVATFSERIRYAMAVKNVKQIDLINITGIDKGSFSSYVSGRYEPKQHKVHLIANALNVNEIWLAGYDVAMDISTSNANSKDNAESLILTEGEKILVNLWRQIPEAKQQMVLEMICIALKTNS